MKIIVATDFSGPARPASALALALARRLDDTVVLAHVLSVPVELGLAGRADIVASLRERAKKTLADSAAALRDQGVSVEERLLEGAAPDAIAALGQELDARLIVLGTRGHSAGARLFVGSVAERTVLLADRPVLIARDDAAMSASARPLRVALGIDRSAASRAAAAWVHALAETIPCEVTVLHAYWPAAELSRLGLSPLVAADTDPRVIENLERELAPIAALAGEGAMPLRLIPTQSSFAACVAGEAERLEADVLVIGTHQRRGLEWLRLGSTVHPLLRASRLPVLCVPAVVDEADEPLAEVRSVLLATDLSPLSMQAIPYAYGLVKPLRGVVHLFHVHEPPVHAARPLSPPMPSPKVEGDARRALEAMVPAAAAAAGITTRTTIVQASRVEDAICQAARRLGADAICLASHGRSGLANTFLGSIAQGVLARADRPVFVVRARR